MSGNPLYSFGASDSGILDALGGLVPNGSTPKQQPTKRRVDRCGQPASGSHAIGDQAIGDVDEDLLRQVRDVPLPEGFIERMRRSLDD